MNSRLVGTLMLASVAVLATGSPKLVLEGSPRYDYAANIWVQDGEVWCQAWITSNDPEELLVVEGIIIAPRGALGSGGLSGWGWGDAYADRQVDADEPGTWECNVSLWYDNYRDRFHLTPTVVVN